MSNNREKTQAQKSPRFIQVGGLSPKRLGVITCWLEVGRLLKVRLRLSFV